MRPSVNAHGELLVPIHAAWPTQRLRELGIVPVVDPLQDTSPVDDSFDIIYRDGMVINQLTGEVLSFPADENLPSPSSVKQLELDFPKQPLPIAVVYIR